MESKLKRCILDAEIVAVAKASRTALGHSKYVPDGMFSEGLKLSNPHIVTYKKKLYLVDGDINKNKVSVYNISTSRETRGGKWVTNTLPAVIIGD